MTKKKDDKDEGKKFFFLSKNFLNLSERQVCVNLQCEKNIVERLNLCEFMEQRLIGQMDH